MEFLDDSDFYGDEETVLALQHRVNDFEVEEWIVKNKKTPGWAVVSQNPAIEGTRFHNPYTGVSYARQLTETVDDFLKRLPPRTTDQTEAVPCIYICNPYISRIDKGRAESQKSKENEDEGPEEEGSRTSLVIEGGMERLELVRKFTEGIKQLKKTPAAEERELGREIKTATMDILHLAHMGKLRTGKWMLFCAPADVNEVWELVAKATAKNELGIAAKVVPNPLDADPRKDRLICVYTSDFNDKECIGRVLQKLRELKLVEARGRPIYYKPDVFTHLGIASGNPWGLRASIYSSKDF